jgi:hypothetical protein
VFDPQYDVLDLLPAEECDFTVNGELTDRSGLKDGASGSVRPIPGTGNWQISIANAEIHEINEDFLIDFQAGPAKLPPSLLPLLACGLECEEDNLNPGKYVFSVSQDCNLDAIRTDNFSGNTGSLSIAYGEIPCGVSHLAVGCVGNATFNFNTEGDNRVMVNYDMRGLFLDSLEDGALFPAETTSGVQAQYSTTRYWGTPLKFENATILITDSGPFNTPVSLSSLSINLNMNVPDVVDPTRKYGKGLAKPELVGYIGVEFTLAQDAVNNTAFWRRFFLGEPSTVAVQVTGEFGSTLRFELDEVYFNPVTRQNIEESRYYAIMAMGARPPADLGIVQSPIRIIWTPATSIP